MKKDLINLSDINLSIISLPVIGAGLAISAGTSNAAMINLTDVYTVTGTELTEGNSYAGTFNINDLLLSDTDISDYEILSANVSVLGYSEVNTSVESSLTAYELLSTTTRDTSYYAADYWSYYVSGFWYSYRRSGTNYYRVNRTATDSTYERTNANRYVDYVRDQMGLTVGTDNFVDVVDTSNESSSSYTSSYRTGSYAYGYTDYNTINLTEYEQWFGDLSINESLSVTSLEDLAIDGLLDFEVSATLGEFTISGVSLNVELEQVASSASSDVPSPNSTLLLFLTGLGVITRFNSKGKAVFEKNS